MKMNDQYYITNVDRPLIIMQLFPFLEWLLPHKFYPITEEQFNYVQIHYPMKPKAKINVFQLSISSMFGGELLYQWIKTHSPLVIISPVVLIIIGLIVGLLTRYSLVGKASLDNAFKSKPVLGWLFPVPVENLDPIFLSIFGVCISIFMLWGAFRYIQHSLLFIIIFSLSIWLYLIINIVCIPKGKYYLWNFNGLKAFKDNKKKVDDK